MDDQIKVEWQGKILSIQPRANVWRYVLDNRTHSHTGYNLFLDGSVDGAGARFSVAVSEKQQQSGGFRVPERRRIAGVSHMWSRMAAGIAYNGEWR